MFECQKSNAENQITYIDYSTSKQYLQNNQCPAETSNANYRTSHGSEKRSAGPRKVRKLDMGSWFYRQRCPTRMPKPICVNITPKYANASRRNSSCRCKFESASDTCETIMKNIYQHFKPCTFVRSTPMNFRRQRAPNTNNSTPITIQFGLGEWGR